MKILYFVHLDWNWIKQRPHFLAEGLSKNYEVLVLYQAMFQRKLLSSNSSHLLKLPYYFPLTSVGGAKLSSIAKSALGGVSTVFVSAVIKAFKPDIIWLPFPTLYKFIKPFIDDDTVIIYDCMDDASEFFQNAKRKEFITGAEVELLERSQIVFASSQNLLDKLIEKGCQPTKAFLVRNAYDGKILPTLESNSSRRKDNKFKICFTGTVSGWLDFESIKYCLDNIKDIEFHFIGPALVTPSFKDERLFFHGPVAHSELPSAVQKYDCTIMPKKVNILTEAMDPVKLYEYINYNKNIITSYYKELDRFSEFVYFYYDERSLAEIIQNLIKNNAVLYSEEQRIKFLQENSWQKRTEKVSKAIEGFNSHQKQHILEESVIS